MKKAVYLTLIFILTICLSACGGKTQTVNGQTDLNIELIATGWNNMAIPSDYNLNPYKKYIDEKYDCNFTLTVTPDLKTELSKRYSTNKGKKPDVVVFYDEQFNIMKQLYNQGWFVEDYTPYLEQIPNIKGCVSEGTNAYYKLTENGNLIALTIPADAHTWAFRIRKDWVEKYSPTGKNPVTVDELLEMGRNIKKDPQMEGKYLFTAAGDNLGVGYLGNFIYMFSNHAGWYVEDNKATNDILSGAHKKWLDFIRTIYQEGLLDPDFYTQSWAQKRGKLATEKVGLDWYCAEIDEEICWSNKDNLDFSGKWTTLYMPTDTVGVERPAGQFESLDRLFVISKDAAKDETKMNKILKFLNDIVYPSDTYYKLRWGIDIDGYEIGTGKNVQPVLDEKGEETGFYAYFDRLKSGAAKHTNGGLWDYGCFLSNRSDKYIEYLTASTYEKTAYEFIKLYNDAINYNDTKCSKNYSEVLNLNVRITNNLSDLTSEYEIAYIRGSEPYPYEQFVENWKSMGGNTLLESVEQQFRRANYIQ